ncbi:MAG: SRPBCC domain-containing protein [Flavobacteriales bacterium]|nr:SRPBCC domain-containing protein [Flavobacteriales bacterium]
MATKKSAPRSPVSTAKPGRVKVAPKGAREIVISRLFAAPRERVFDAFSKPAMVKQWLHGPPGWTLEVCRIDLRVGGTYQYVWRNHARQEMGLSGVYTEVVRPERIVNTEVFEPAWYPGEALSTLVLTERKDGTLMTVTARYDSRRTRDAILASPMEGGLEFSYQRLDTLLATPGKSRSKKVNGLFAGVSEPDTVDVHMKALKHPLKGVAQRLREVILSADKRVGEGIHWNAPCFYFTGEMEPFDPKTYKRYIVGFNFFKRDTLRLIFLRGAEVKNTGGLLEGNYADGRRLALFGSLDDVKRHEKELKRIVKALITHMN